MAKEAFRTSIGGQAIIEGIVMKGPEKTCMAVRRPDGEISADVYATHKNPLRKIPILRGAAAMILSMIEGYKSIMKSSDIAFPDGGGDDAFDRFIKKKFGDKAGMAVGAVAAVLGTLLAVALFILLPTYLTGALSNVLPLGGWRSAVEGVIKIAIFLLYLFAVTRQKDIRRVFEYHGAEHKSIACYEHGDELTVENVRKYSRFHPRCGTSFLFIVILISILAGAFIPWTQTAVRALAKLALLPLIMGISYEIIKYAGAHDNLLCRILSAPGLWIQRLTAFEPDDSMIEVALTALKAVLPANAEEARW
ncbi:MAG: DUF1385 domain-containing protein [Oscillospiraceae bacterium]|nr:DUF1385 domain-containing protein [Oscillospiraceae bacterium]